MSNGRDTRRVCRISLPTTSIFGGHKRDTLVHFSGIIFFLGWWVFLDSVFQSSLSTIENPNPVSVQFSDWLPGLCSVSSISSSFECDLVEV